MTLHYTTPHSNSLHSTFPYTTLNYTSLQCAPLPQLQLQLQLRYFTLYYARLYYTTLHYIAQHSLHDHKYACTYTALITLPHIYNSTTLQLQLQLRYTTVHPAVVGEVHCNHCNHSKKTQLQPPFGQPVASLCHPSFTATNLSYRFPILKLPPPPCAVLLVYV